MWSRNVRERVHAFIGSLSRHHSIGASWNAITAFHLCCRCISLVRASLEEGANLPGQRKAAQFKNGFDENFNNLGYLMPMLAERY